MDGELDLRREPAVPIEWQRDAAIAMLDVAGPSESLTGVGESVNNVRVELALAQPQIQADYYTRTATRLRAKPQGFSTCERGAKRPKRLGTAMADHAMPRFRFARVVSCSRGLRSAVRYPSANQRARVGHRRKRHR